MEISNSIRRITVTDTVNGTSYTGELSVNDGNRVYNGTIYVNNGEGNRIADVTIATNNPASMGVNKLNETMILKTVREYQDGVLLDVTTKVASMIVEVEAKATANQL